MKRLIFLILLLAATEALAGDNTYKFCRGGANQGLTCSTDSDCPADSGGAAGICTILGHPRYCSYKRYCNLSTNLLCDGNWDCREAHGGLWPFIDKRDSCSALNGFSGYVPCSTASDCRVCTAGTKKGQSCTSTGSNTSQCGTGGVCGSAGANGVTCINGIEQSQIYRWRQTSGLPNDLVPDHIVGGRTLEDAPTYNYTAGKFLAPSSVAYDYSTNDLWVGDVSRCMKFNSGWAFGSLASLALGQPDMAGVMDEVLPGEISQDSLGFPTRRTIGWSYTTDCLPFHGDYAGIIAGTRYKVGRFPVSPVQYDARVAPIFGVTGIDATSFAAYGVTDHNHVAALDRCVGGSNIGKPCPLNSCPGSSCKTTLCASIGGNNAGEVGCWRDAAGASDGASPDFHLGGADSLFNYCNTGATLAKSLCLPAGLDFDPFTGDLLIADQYNHRVVVADHAMTGNDTWARCLGQPDCLTITSGVSNAKLTLPGDVAVDRGSGAVAIADTFANRVPYYSAMPGSSGATFTSCLGQPDCNSGGTGRSSDGTKCDRLNGPKSVTFDSAGHVIVADTNNRRTYQFNTPATTNSGDNATNAKLLGQSDCTKADPPIDAAHYSNQISGFAFTGSGAAIITDYLWNRALVYTSSSAALTGYPNANGILGQANGTSILANKGGSPSASTLNNPAGAAWTAGGPTAPAGLYITEYSGNMIKRWGGSTFTTNEDADVQFGQGLFETNDCNHFQPFDDGLNGARNLCGPRGITTDSFGNFLVADSLNHRVKFYCMEPTTPYKTGPGPTATLCNIINSGDDAADWIGGQANDISNVSTGCTSPSKSSLCTPVDVAIDDSTPTNPRFFVVDKGPGDGKGRIAMWQMGTDWATGGDMAAVFGSLPGAGNEFTTFSSSQLYGNGQCETAFGVPTGQSCQWQAPDGWRADTGFCIAGGQIGECVGPGTACSIPGVGSGTCYSKCAGGTNEYNNGINCTSDAECPGGTCGCPADQVCTRRRVIGDATGITYDPDHQYLYIARGGGVAQMGPPFTNNAPLLRVGMKGDPGQGFDNFWGFGDFTEMAYGGSAVYNTLRYDRNGGKLWSAMGDLFANTGALVFDDPVFPTNTPTVTRTGTVTRTLTPTNTPTSTPTVTLTVTGTPPAATSTPTITPTFTPTRTSTATVTATVTNTAGGPTNTPTPVPATATNTPLTAYSWPYNMEGATIPEGSTCVKEKLNYNDHDVWVVTCPTGANAFFIAKIGIVPSMPATLRLSLHGNAESAGSNSCWKLGVTADAVGNLDPSTMPFDLSANVSLPHDTAAGASISTMSSTAIVNAANFGFPCSSDNECDGQTAYVKIARDTIFLNCLNASDVHLTQLWIEWPISEN